MTTLNPDILRPHTKSAWGDTPEWPGSRMSRQDIETRISTYNKHHEGTRLELISRNGEDSLKVEGPLRINWDVKSNISFQKLDESVVPKETNDWRRSYCDSNGLDEDLLETLHGGGPLKRSEEVEDIKLASLSLDETDSSNPVVMRNSATLRYNTLGGAVVRRRKRVPRSKRRLSMINGHVYDLDSSNFTPTDGSVTTVRVTSRDNAPAVIRLLLHKFKVQNNPDEFCLCSVKKTGETRILQDTDYPLLQRVLMGPLEEEARMFLRDKDKVKDISHEVAQFMNLPETMLNNFLQKIDDEERAAKHQAIVKYQKIQNIIEERLKDLETPSWGID